MWWNEGVSSLLGFIVILILIGIVVWDSKSSLKHYDSEEEYEEWHKENDMSGR